MMDHLIYFLRHGGFTDSFLDSLTNTHTPLQIPPHPILAMASSHLLIRLILLGILCTGAFSYCVAMMEQQYHSSLGRTNWWADTGSGSSSSSLSSLSSFTGSSSVQSSTSSLSSPSSGTGSVSTVTESTSTTSNNNNIRQRVSVTSTGSLTDISMLKNRSFVLFGSDTSFMSATETHTLHRSTRTTTSEGGTQTDEFEDLQRLEARVQWYAFRKQDDDLDEEKDGSKKDKEEEEEAKEMKVLEEKEGKESSWDLVAGWKSRGASE